MFHFSLCSPNGFLCLEVALKLGISVGCEVETWELSQSQLPTIITQASTGDPALGNVTWSPAPWPATAVPQSNAALAAPFYTGPAVGEEPYLAWPNAGQLLATPGLLLKIACAVLQTAHATLQIVGAFLQFFRKPLESLGGLLKHPQNGGRYLESDTQQSPICELPFSHVFYTI